MLHIPRYYKQKTYEGRVNEILRALKINRLSHASRIDPSFRGYDGYIGTCLLRNKIKKSKNVTRRSENATLSL